MNFKVINTKRMALVDLGGTAFVFETSETADGKHRLTFSTDLMVVESVAYTQAVAARNLAVKIEDAFRKK